MPKEQLGFVRGWTDIGDPTSTEYRWEALRRHADGCQISHIFYKYLGKTTPAPERLPPYQPNAGNRLYLIRSRRLKASRTSGAVAGHAYRYRASFFRNPGLSTTSRLTMPPGNSPLDSARTF